ncbi:MULTISPECIES: sensor domain-containing diguanylate cyclase [Metasolibacillus]|uniref:sensor domain-containing diguanylate cyclase n=1 Tax=Metasolibacillus TaxID=2703677 RepID=UPI000D33EC78|nr:sensor domain-containing diguanylate cyclase [Metasolibacillus fluoroglycofenilyticus]
MNNLYLTIINQLDNGIILLDEQLNIQLWNNWLEKFTGQDERDVKGLKVTQVIPRLNKSLYISMFEKALLNKQKNFCSAAMHEYFVDCEHENTKKLRQNMLVRHIELDNQVYVMLEIHDVTNHYERIRKLNKSLQNSIGFTKSLERFAFYDSLTNLPNRKFIVDRIESLTKQEDARFTLFFLDLNGFKSVNDSFGHTQGDQLLQMVAERCQQLTDEQSVFARLGGDEFVLLVENLSSAEQHDKQIEKIHELLLEPFIIEDQSISITTSIGYACFPQDGVTVKQLLNIADRQMYLHKQKMNNE